MHAYVCVCVCKCIHTHTPNTDYYGIRIKKKTTMAYKEYESELLPWFFFFIFLRTWKMVE